jgi:hypothetical protein
VIRYTTPVNCLRCCSKISVSAVVPVMINSFSAHGRWRLRNLPISGSA